MAPCSSPPWAASLLSDARRQLARLSRDGSIDPQAENQPFGPTVSTAARRSLRLSACPRRAAASSKCVSNDTPQGDKPRSEEHTSELQSLMRNSYAVFCLKKKTQQTT